MVVPLHMGWREALFANWPVDPAAVAPHVPDSVSLDTYDGEAWLTVLPFVNVDVRPPLFPTGVRVPEVNLRTYVTRDGRPAIYFLSLDAASALTVLGARFTHFLPYYFATIDVSTVDRPAGAETGHRVGVETGRPVGVETGHRVRFESRRRHPGVRPAAFVAEYGPDGERLAAEPGSLARFLTERHRYYTESPTGTLRYADVRHPRWPLYPADATVERNTLFRANDFETPDGSPTCYYSPGVDVSASRNRRWRPASAERRVTRAGATRGR